MNEGPPRSPLRLLWSRRQRMLAEEKDLVAWWWNFGAGRFQPKINSASLTAHPDKWAPPAELTSFLLAEMKRRGFWEYARHSAEAETERLQYNQLQAQKRAEEKQQRAQQAQAPTPDKQGSSILGPIILVAVALMLVTFLLFGKRTPGCGRASDWECDQFLDRSISE